jgi:hypothetical protein
MPEQGYTEVRRKIDIEDGHYIKWNIAVPDSLRTSFHRDEFDIFLKELDNQVKAAVSASSFENIPGGALSGILGPNSGILPMGIYLHISETEPDGPFERYGTRGNLEARGTRKEGELDGSYREYFSTGQIAATYNYKNGILHGEFEIRDHHGETLTKGEYENGLQVGLWEYPQAPEGEKFRWFNDGSEVVPSAETKEELHETLSLFMRGEIAHENLSSSEDNYRGFVLENTV